MSIKHSLAAALAATATLLALPALAEPDIAIEDAYAFSAGAMARSGAAFFTIVNEGDTDDRLVAASTEAAAVAELHTHIAGDDGVLMMREVEDGFPVAAGDSHALMRGGDHVMMMGLTAPLEQGEIVTLTLTFEVAGEMVVEVPVDLERGAEGAMQMSH